ncbi:biotin/lipoyl-containing protein [Roseibium aggregatum]|uniref:Dihydrolipoamide acetyltransferase n=1 Tax=Roseibium aggregatum TaxID=187304 RepID=A0A926P521_9HYPH|nr:biotin/lipoyl-containing protein [Roseibium aggregatum]MBD1549718.1 dihydrolipoamide acetyltransferase [Roseibium aggregatum]
MAHDVIMPALGMAQETGLILAWRKSPGDAVKAGDVLMEVETDKAAMEVEAQADGFLSEVRAEEGAEVPVGEVIAVISDSADDVKAAPSKQEASQKEESKPEAPPAPKAEPAPQAVQQATPQAAQMAPSEQPADGKVLASPKAKRLAAERGLDLSRLAKAGHPQPYRVADLEVLSAMPAAGAASAVDRLLVRASVEADAFDAFCGWLAAESKVETDITAGMVLASFAARSLRAVTGAADVVVRVAAPRKQPRTYQDPDLAGLTRMEASETEPEPDLIVYDLTATRLTHAELAAAHVPTLTVARDGVRLVVSLAASPDRLDDAALIACLDAFAGRLEEPLRQLL